ncbi:BCCT family transporter [Salicibibacter kimchii]|uniref:BCCT family transporter n=1 Tax=Salicibibacter kimchii TaxID=2099786 RepID=UPI00135C9E01|nr:BCCT family transporter [Salicibibacter kimchii]
MKNLNLDHKILWPVLVILLLVLVPIGINPSAAENIVGTTLDFITSNFGWLYLLFPFAILVFFIWILFGRLGRTKLGDPDDKPEFSTFSWFAMIFTTGIAAEIMYESIMEPLHFFNGPPFGIEPETLSAAEWAIPYSFFHWGILTWAIYALPSIPIAYALYIKKIPYLKLSAVCRPILGKHSDGIVGKIIDIITIVGLIGVVGTSIGLVAPMVARFIGELFNIPVTFGLLVIVIALWVIIFGTSVYVGLNKGIKRLSNFNIILVIVITAFVFIAGPTIFMLDNSIHSLGTMLSNFFQMGLNLDPIRNEGFPQTWTVFYWAWWIGYAALIGLFTARVSKGRTIRQMILAQCLLGPVGCWVFFSVYGNYGLHLQLFESIPLTSILVEEGATDAVVAVMNSLPFSTIIIALLIVVYLIFSATTFDAASFILASMSSKKLDNMGQPPRIQRLFWAFVLGLVGIFILYIGGLEAVQLASVVVGVPMILVFALVTISFIKTVREDFGKNKSTYTKGNQIADQEEDIYVEKGRNINK